MSDELTAVQVAERLGVGRSTVNLWCRQGKFPGARREDSPVGVYWMIPTKDLKDFTPPPRGRTPKAKPAETTGTLDKAFREATGRGEQAGAKPKGSRKGGKK
jgi:hypothetical protein